MSDPAPRLVLSRSAVEELRPAAEAFAEAVARGARGVARIARDGEVRFSSPAVAELHQDLGEALRAALAGAPTEWIESRSGRPFAAFVDRVVAGWLRAEPGIGDFLRSDARGHGGYLFDALRADLGELGLELEVETAAEGYPVAATTSRRRFILPVVGGAWIGAALGLMLELAGVEAAASFGFFGGLGLGTLLALYAGARPGLAACSECGSPVEHTARACPRCRTSFVESVEAAEPEGLAGGEHGPLE